MFQCTHKIVNEDDLVLALCNKHRNEPDWKVDINYTATIIEAEGDCHLCLARREAEQEHKRFLHVRKSSVFQWKAEDERRQAILQAVERGRTLSDEDFEAERTQRKVQLAESRRVRGITTSEARTETFELEDQIKNLTLQTQ